PLAPSTTLFRSGGRAGSLRVLGQEDRLRRRVRPRPGDDRHAAAGRLDAELDDTHMLFMAERGRFAGGAAGHERTGPFVDLPLDEALKGIGVDRAVAERRDEDGDGPLEHAALLESFDLLKKTGSRT